MSQSRDKFVTAPQNKGKSMPRKLEVKSLSLPEVQKGLGSLRRSSS
jgi:hypothetical protein